MRPSNFTVFALVLANLAFLCECQRRRTSSSSSGRRRLGRNNREYFQNPPDYVGCPAGKSAVGLSIGIPSSLSWRPDAPYILCLLCASPKTEEERKFFEVDSSSTSGSSTSTSSSSTSASNSNSGRVGYGAFMQEVCSYYGDDSRTLTQKFDCVSGEFLHGFLKENSTLNSKLTCIKTKPTSPGSDVIDLSKNESRAVYESSFPLAQRGNSVARRNWQYWIVDSDCPTDDGFLCGMKITQPTEDNGPSLSAQCCDPYIYANGDIHISALRETQRSSSKSAAVAVLAVFFTLALILIALLLAHIFCCPIFTDCSSLKSTFYEQTERFKSGRSGRGGTASQFNTRPNTAAPPSMRNGRNGNSATGKKPSLVSIGNGMNNKANTVGPLAPVNPEESVREEVSDLP